MEDEMEPFGMLEAQAIEDGPHRIADAAHKEKENTRIPADAFDEGIERDDDEPPHQDVVDDAKNLEFLKVDGVKDNAKDPKSQTGDEDGIAPSRAIRAKTHESVRNVSAHDENENVIVVQNAEDAFKRSFGESVIKGASEIEDEKGNDKDDARGYLPRIIRCNGLCNQERTTDESEKHS